MLNRRNFILNLLTGYFIVNKNNIVYSHDNASKSINKTI